jgi:hypothetical protein
MALFAQNVDAVADVLNGSRSHENLSCDFMPPEFLNPMSGAKLVLISRKWNSRKWNSRKWNSRECSIPILKTLDASSPQEPVPAPYLRRLPAVKMKEGAS